MVKMVEIKDQSFTISSDHDEVVEVILLLEMEGLCIIAEDNGSDSGAKAKTCLFGLLLKHILIAVFLLVNLFFSLFCVPLLQVIACVVSSTGKIDDMMRNKIKYLTFIMIGMSI
ncbi:unnamed protein product [Musa textilis]